MKALAAIWMALMALPWKQKCLVPPGRFLVTPAKIPLTRRAKGGLGMSNLICFEYFLISLMATASRKENQQIDVFPVNSLTSAIKRIIAGAK